MISESLFGEEVPHTNMERYIGQTAVVTGASSGIGAALCEMLVKIGVNVVGVARRAELVEELAEKLNGEKGKLYARKCDLRDEQQIYAVFDWIETNLGAVAILINNAGLTLPTPLNDGDVDVMRTVINVNVMGLCICTKMAIASMKAHQQDGHVVHISSIQAHKVLDVPYTNVYPASKFAVRALTETLRHELRTLTTPRIRISAVSPGLVATGLIDGFTTLGGLQDSLRQMPILQPEDVADTVIYVLSRPPHVQIHDLIVKVAGEAF